MWLQGAECHRFGIYWHSFTKGIGKDSNELCKTADQRLFCAQDIAYSDVEQENRHKNTCSLGTELEVNRSFCSSAFYITAPNGCPVKEKHAYLTRDKESVTLSIYSKENCAPGFVRVGH